MNLVQPLNAVNSIDDLAVCIQAKVDSGELPAVEMPLLHYHTKDLYGRRIIVPAGCIFTTAIHKTDHMSIALRGRITMLSASGESMEVVAPDMFVTPAGTHRVVYVHEEVEFATVHACTEQDDDQVTEALTFNTMAEYQRYDYNKAVNDAGFTDAQARYISESLADQVPMPEGEILTHIAPSAIEGQGVFASTDIASGDRIAPGRIGTFRTPVGRYANHSSFPNTRYILAGDNIDMYAIKNIRENEELTVNYRQANRVRLGAEQ
ncbi:MAG: SET domain-containing protein-lysine N-methyltransferase [Dehalococcoidia bacterium]|nr:SET domain-containing protein-lysine N-methyltransferase [Dehalococcoidia bacterium]